jgi:hypothetical protein
MQRLPRECTILIWTDLGCSFSRLSYFMQRLPSVVEQCQVLLRGYRHIDELPLLSCLLYPSFSDATLDSCPELLEDHVESLSNFRELLFARLISP